MTKEDLIKAELKKCSGYSNYNGWNNNRTEYGYHSYIMDDFEILGQRNPQKRISKIKKYLDFNNKNLIDFGCNVGAMIHHLPELNYGFGFDYDEKCINSANRISKILDIKNNYFLVHDFDKDPYDKLKLKINFKPDIIFILSLGSWIKSWEELYTICLEYNCKIIIEINNEIEGLPQLYFFKDKNCKLTLISDCSDDDITGNFLRKMYLVEHYE